MVCWNYMVELIVIVFVPIYGSIVLPGWVSKFGLSIESFYLESKYGDSIWNFVSQSKTVYFFLLYVLQPNCHGKCNTAKHPAQYKMKYFIDQ